MSVCLLHLRQASNANDAEGSQEIRGTSGQNKNFDLSSRLCEVRQAPSSVWHASSSAATVTIEDENPQMRNTLFSR